MPIILLDRPWLRIARAATIACAVFATLAASSPLARAEAVTRVLPDGTLYVSNIAPANALSASASTAATAERRPAPAERPPAPTGAKARDLRAAITRVAERYGLPTSLIEAVIAVESGFKVRAVSPKGALGLMQLMPQTAAILGVKDAFDPIANVEGGVRHLRGLIDQFSNNLPLALAAYNAGAGAVTRYGGIPPYRETQDYVARILKRFGGVLKGAEAPEAPKPQEVEQSNFERIYRADGTIVYTNRPADGASASRAGQGGG
jgi:soluble lytic murein transglycosylase-like protein